MKLLLIGAGNMGEAMLKGLQKYDISVVEANEKRREELKKAYKNVVFLGAMPDIEPYILILAIKPQSLQKLQVKGRAKGLISILAGVDLKTLKEKIQAKYYIRAMPNMAALKQKSATSLCGDEELKKDAISVLESIGKCFWLQSEDELDIAMALAGCAPAWLALVAEALSDGAVNLGLKRDLSFKMLASLFEGVGATLQDVHPAILKDRVTSPKGTTIAGYKALEKGSVRNAFLEAMEEAYGRAKK
ncbi:MAG: pyrroline-5-carboxylate reductase [Proteobacteria bacterium]|nr:MAG: pyrroline-5-carboxylate reductase [Pseudomonadota bacterium]